MAVDSHICSRLKCKIPPHRQLPPLHASHIFRRLILYCLYFKVIVYVPICTKGWYRAIPSKQRLPIQGNSITWLEGEHRRKERICVYADFQARCRIVETKASCNHRFKEFFLCKVTLDLIVLWKPVTKTSLLDTSKILCNPLSNLLSK